MTNYSTSHNAEPIVEEDSAINQPFYGRFAVKQQNRIVSPTNKAGHTSDTRRHHKPSTKKSDVGKASGTEGRTGKTYKKAKMKGIYD